jgi:hypothetical protein
LERVVLILQEVQVVVMPIPVIKLDLLKEGVETI